MVRFEPDTVPMLTLSVVPWPAAVMEPASLVTVMPEMLPVDTLPGEVTLPIPAYLIEHPKGTALFDTGMHPDCRTNPAARDPTLPPRKFHVTFGRAPHCP